MAAIKKAEAETKAKTDKMIEIRHLNGEIAQVKSDTSKLEEQLEDCKRCPARRCGAQRDRLPVAASPPLRYKAFLDKLTPTEWFEEQQEAQRQRREDAWAAKEEARRAMCYERAAVDAAQQIDRERVRSPDSPPPRKLHPSPPLLLASVARPIPTHARQPRSRRTERRRASGARGKRATRSGPPRRPSVTRPSRGERSS